MFRAALHFSGYQVAEAGDGWDALRVLEHDGIDLVILDLGLPLISGQVVLQEMASRSHLRELPLVVVVTGQPGPHHFPNAACVLTKPVTPERLVGAVNRCVGSGS